MILVVTVGPVGVPVAVGWGKVEDLEAEVGGGCLGETIGPKVWEWGWRNEGVGDPSSEVQD